VAQHAKADIGKGKLKRKAARAGLVTLSVEVFRTGIRIASTAVLARLLTPDDFGVVAISLGFITILQAISAAGISEAALRERELTAQQSTNLFWCNTAISLAIALLAAAGSSLLADFVNDPRVALFTPVAAIGLVFSGLGAQHRVILTRELRFGQLARMEATASLLGSGVAIVLAAMGTGPWSIVIGTLTTNIQLSIAPWIYSGWRPGRFRQGHGTKRLIRRGFGLMVASVSVSVRFSSESVILGRFAGAADVGLYSKAYGLLTLPLTQMLQPMSRVAVPILVQIWHDPERFRKSYFRLVSVLGLLSTPAVAFLFFGAEDVVRIVLGEQFLPSVPIFRILAISSIGMATAASSIWVQQASGKVKRQLGLALATSSVVVVANIIGAWLGGAKGMAIGFVTAIQLMRQPTCYLGLLGSPVSYRDLLAAALPGTVVALVGSAAMAVPEFLLDLPRPFTSLSVTWSLGLAAMAATALAWPRVRADISGMMDLMRAARTRDRGKGIEPPQPPLDQDLQPS
jgi:PST family polysaccharide transporter